VDDFAVLLQEAIQTVEDELKLEDAGWISLSASSVDIIPNDKRIENLKASRLYHALDPLAHQAIRLWTDYTLGSGITWGAEDEGVKKVLEAFWNSRANKGVLSAQGQRKSSDKLLVDGEIFFAVFLASSEALIRRINPLEITEIISDPDDIENVMYYKRAWTTGTGEGKVSIYRSWTNAKDVGCKDNAGKVVTATPDAKDALVYHVAYNTIGQRGNPLLLPALDWLKQYRRFLASRVAIMLALAKFAWRSKVKGGAAAVESVRASLDGKDIAAGSTLTENLGVDTQPIRQDTGSSGAYQDGRMLKLQVCAAVGIPEQYFGDISIGNLATAKTVELPMMKMFESYQTVWDGVYQDLDEIVLEKNGISPDKWYVDRDFPAIAPEDVLQAADALVKVIGVMPEFADLADVQQTALMILGINDTAEVLDQLSKESGNVDAETARVFKRLKAVLQESGRNGKGH